MSGLVGDGTQRAIDGATGRRSGARGQRPVPHRRAEFDELTLEGLRAYRKTLTEEEDRVSYWRRIIQARLDVLRAGLGDRSDVGRLRPVLTRHHMSRGRQALVAVLPAEEVPPLPNLAELWACEPAADDQAARELLVCELSAAEEQLSAYRATLHRRLAEATGELVARYHENPALCLSILPLPEKPAGAA